MSDQNEHKNVIVLWHVFGFFLASVLTVFFFLVVLPVKIEAFYMSVPIIGLMFLIIFQRAVIPRYFNKKNIIRLALYLVIMLSVFNRLSLMMGGRILWVEFFLAGYFLVSIGLILLMLQSAMKWFAQKVSGFPDNKKGKAFYLILYSGLWLFVILPYILAVFSLHRPKIGDRLDPQSFLNLPYEDVQLTTRDQLKLAGWFVPHPSSNKAVVIGHGLGANKSNFISLVSLWHGLGYNVLIFDFRGHGHSAGHTVSFGWKERYDIQAAVDYLEARSAIDPQAIVGYGVSFGGGAMVQAAAEDPRIRVVILDSAFADFDTMSQKVVAQMRIIPPFLYKSIAWIGLKWAEVELGGDLLTYAPKATIQRFKNQPVLIIHSQQDKLIPVEEAQALYDAAHEPKKLYLVESGGHYATLYDQHYVDIIAEFLLEHEKTYGVGMNR